MSEPIGSKQFTYRLLVAIAAIVLAFVVVAFLWHVSQILLILFAAILVAIFLDGLTRFGQQHARMPRWVALPVALLAVILILAGFGQAVGAQLLAQIAQLADILPRSLEKLRAALMQPPFKPLVAEISFPQLLPTPGELLDRITGIFSVTLGILTTPFLIAVLALYLVIDPDLYTNGLVRMLPPDSRPRAREVLGAVGHALRWWLVGRIVSMLVVGALTVIGLVVVGVPAALALGVIAGALSFVPYIGPIASVVPALLATLPNWPWQAVWVLVVYGGVQVLESNFITPLVQERAVAMPPVVLLTAQVAFAALFGLLGVLLASPLAVVVMVLVQMLYIQDGLGEAIRVLGQQRRRNA